MNKRRAYLKIDDDQFINDMLQGVIHIIFEASEGSQVEMKCTLNNSYVNGLPLTAAEKQHRAELIAAKLGRPVKVLHAWNLDKQCWTTFALDRLLSAQQVGGA